MRALLSRFRRSRSPAIRWFRKPAAVVAPSGSEDIDDREKYVKLPNKRDLDLGPRLVMRFTREELPDRYDEVAEIFSRRGAYRRFKDLLEHEGALDKWFEFENAAEEKALREWCADNGVVVEG